MKVLFTILSVLILSLSSCKSLKYQGVNYDKPNNSKLDAHPSLNIFRPKEADDLLDVLIFIHGATPESDEKETYSYIGRNFAKKNVITLIPDYIASPDNTNANLAMQIHKSILWAKEHISYFGGNPERIFVMGYARGATLAALATLQPEYLNQSSIKGLILNDALNLSFSENNGNKTEQIDKKPATAESYLPEAYINEKTPPVKVYVGTKTRPEIFMTNEQFVIKLKEIQTEAKLDLLDKKHGAMMSQYLWPWSNRYQEIVSFMKKQ